MALSPGTDDASVAVHLPEGGPSAMPETDLINGQPVGAVVPDWAPRPRPPAMAMQGRTCRLEPLDPGRHAGDLWQAVRADADGLSWTYMGYGPFADEPAYRAFLESMAGREDPQMFAVVEQSGGRALGVLSFLRIDPANGVIEIGHVWFSPLLARTTAATEALVLMMRRAFDELGYRRLEWKCNALNTPSRRAAERLGFTFEGIFRQAMVVRGRNRDTAWYAMLDGEWPAARAAMDAWLAPDNFAPDGRQHRPLRVGG